MKLVSRSATKTTFNLLSVGQRGVGKTVFLAGSYVELNTEQKRSQELWFDCQDNQVQENVERILNYIAQTNQYPPPTIKITNFSFDLKRQSRRDVQTLCHFNWYDIPGEICNPQNQEFRKMVSSSHGCCVFIDASALVQSKSYVGALEEIIEQVTAIANLVYLNKLKYAFAIIFTKCDLLEHGLYNRQQLEESLQPLTMNLDAVKANYQVFYSSIPLVQINGVSTLKAEGAVAPLIWLVWELSKVYSPSLTDTLLDSITGLLPSSLQSQQERANQATFGNILNSNGKASAVKKLLGVYLFPSRYRYILLVVLAIASSGAIISSLFVDYQHLLSSRYSNITNPSNLAILQEPEKLQNTISTLENLVQQEPENLELKLKLGQLYEFTGDVNKAEAAYDQILAKEGNNYVALSRKAILRYAQGDTKQATALFTQAEKAAPDELKMQIRELAEVTFKQPTK